MWQLLFPMFQRKTRMNCRIWLAQLLLLNIKIQSRNKLSIINKYVKKQMMESQSKIFFSQNLIQTVDLVLLEKSIIF